MIVAELARKGVSTPRGKRHWTRSSVHNILANRSYAGIVEALKTEAVVPKRRAGNTYGKSTSRSRPESERIRLEGLVEHPIVSEDEYEWMRRRLQDNKRFALKNTKRRRYLLSGMVRCAECGRAYVGVSRKQGAYAYYVCGRRWNPGSGAARCESRYLRAEVVEHSVFQMVSEFLTGREGFGAEILRRQATSKVTLASLRKEIADLDRQDRGERDAEARAFNLASHNTLSEESFKEVTGLINAKRVWISEQQARALSQVEELERHQVDPDAVGTLRRRLSARLNGGTDEDRRFVLEAVGAKVIVQADGQWELELQIPRQDPEPAKPDLQIVNSSPRGPNGETRTWRRGHSTSLRVHKKAGCV
jgi:site-specific DNA recombinase